MLNFKSGVLITKKEPQYEKRLMAAGYREAILAKYDLSHNNGKTTLSFEIEMLICPNSGKILDTKLEIYDLAGDDMASMLQKLGSWLSRLSEACTEPMKILNFLPVYAMDWDKVRELEIEREKNQPAEPNDQEEE